jgi:hypothetical protein
MIYSNPEAEIILKERKQLGEVWPAIGVVREIKAPIPIQLGSINYTGEGSDNETGGHFHGQSKNFESAISEFHQIT